MSNFFSLGNEEMEDLELDDADLLASLEAQEEVERARTEPSRDSGYGTLSEPSTQSLRSSSIRSLVSTASSRWVVMSMRYLYDVFCLTLGQKKPQFKILLFCMFCFYSLHMILSAQQWVKTWIIEKCVEFQNILVFYMLTPFQRAFCAFTESLSSGAHRNVQWVWG